MLETFIEQLHINFSKSNISSLAVIILLLLGIVSCEKVDNEPFQPAQTLKFDDTDGFASAINPLFDTNINGKTCASADCHNAITGNGGRFKINANVTDANSIEMIQNYLNTLSFIDMNQPEASLLLLEPLTGSYAPVGSHGGGDIFISTGDENYLLLYQWIANPIANPSINDSIQ